MATKRPAAAMAPAESVASSGGSERGELVRLVFSPAHNPDSAVLTITLLGDQHTLRDAAELLFKNYLEEQLDRWLDENVRGFTPKDGEQSGGGMSDEDDEDDNYDMAIMPGQPLQSTRLGVYHMFMGDPPEADYPKVEKPGGAAEADSPAPRSTQPACPADAAFPGIAAAILSRRYSDAFVGACARSLFGAIEGSLADNGDQLFMLKRMASLEDWFLCAEAAWPAYLEADSGTGNVNRRGWTNLFVFPPQPGSAKEEAKTDRFMRQAERMAYLSSANVDLNKIQGPPWKATNAEVHELCGPALLPSRLTPAEAEAARARLRASGFDFGQLFPKLTALYGAHKYAWFSYRGGRLVVSNKEMLNASEERLPRAGALLDTRRAFSSLHALLEAVEAAL
eukprot:jgi/Tetstr1/433219/TSEL_022507.t1